MNMELKYLATVKKIIETGNYQNAARALNYAQSTITFQMKQLESELGIQIFEKNGNKMELTQAGVGIIPIIDRILEATEELVCYHDGIEEMRGTLSGFTRNADHISDATYSESVQRKSTQSETITAGHELLCDSRTTGKWEY